MRTLEACAQQQRPDVQMSLASSDAVYILLDYAARESVQVLSLSLFLSLALARALSLSLSRLSLSSV